MRIPLQPWRISSRYFPSIIVSLVYLGACGGPTDPIPDPGDPGLTFVAGAGRSDTVGAMPAQALVVQVWNEEGRPVAREAVHFSGTVRQTSLGLRRTVLVGSLTTTDFAGETVVSTDGTGRVAVRIRMGSAAGPGGVDVTVPVKGYRKTADYTIEPGAPARLLVTPDDTAVFIDHSYAIVMEVQDRFGNRRPDDEPALEAGSQVVSVSDGEITGERLGRTEVVVRLGDLVAGAKVSVVPLGEFAVLEYGIRGEDSVVVRGLDGSNARRLTDAGYGAHGLTSWAPDGESIAYWNGGTRRLRVVSVDGQDRRLVPVPLTDWEGWPHYSRDGRWIYWAGTPESRGMVLYRVKPDGSGAEQIGPDAANGWEVDTQPTPSPDGSQLAYVSNRSGTTLRILDIPTGTSTDLGIVADRPRWSPVDERIAFTADGMVHIARPDGTVREVATESGSHYRGGLAWSPDGSWLLVAEDGGGLELLDPETGETIPLPYTNRDMSHPSWRPPAGN